MGHWCDVRTTGLVTKGAMRLLLKILLFVIVGTWLGLYSAKLAMTDGLQAVVVKNGPWSTWPHAASPSADPYTRAHFAGLGKLPVSSFEAVTFRATSDSAGAPLRRTCSYLLSGVPPTARWWSVTAYDEDGQLIGNAAERHSFNSVNVLRASDGTFQISLAPAPSPGNWIPVDGTGPLVLLFRVYNPEATFAGNLAGAPLPAIERQACA